MSKLSNIEQEMQEVIEANMFRSDDKYAMAKAAASVARRYIEKAWEDAEENEYQYHVNMIKRQTKEEWLKENGIE
jgi:hypothetical protein